MDLKIILLLCIFTLTIYSFGTEQETCECPEGEECHEIKGDNSITTKVICIPPKCLENVEKGPCRARHIRWYYNRTEEECQMFFYGGCRGNENRFRTKEDCKNICMANF